MDGCSIDFVPLRSVGKDRTGERFGRWTVLGYAGRLRWWCRCECGVVKCRDIKTLRKGKSLGCMTCRDKDSMVRIGSHRLYQTWNGMRQRCFNPKDASYKHYGARGIVVCAEWNQDFSAFYRWALKTGYAANLTIERLDNDKGYQADNCTWIPHGDQARNRRNLVIIDDGEIRAYQASYARKKGVPLDLLLGRLRAGWNLDDAVNVPNAKHNRRRDNVGRYAAEVKTCNSVASVSTSTPRSTPDAAANCRQTRRMSFI